jgi:hypothetical protein
MEENEQKSKYVVIEAKVAKGQVDVGQRRYIRYFNDNIDTVCDILNGRKITWNERTFKVRDNEKVKFGDIVFEADEYNVVYKGFNENQAEKAFNKRGVTK